jgi:hypothetical protein
MIKITLNIPELRYYIIERFTFKDGECVVDAIEPEEKVRLKNRFEKLIRFDDLAKCETRIKTVPKKKNK